MAGFTEQEKVVISEFLDALKGWYNAVPNGIPERTFKDRLIRSIEKMKETSE